MTINIEALKAATLAATPGEWKAGNAYEKPFIPAYQIITDSEDGPYVILEGNKNFLEDAEKNVAYVAAANPAAVLALIERLERTERNRDMWKAQCERQAEALEKQARAAKTGMDAAKAGASAMQENARRMLAESNPDALESERQANAILTAENERLREELRQIYSHQAELAGWKP